MIRELTPTATGEQSLDVAGAATPASGAILLVGGALLMQLIAAVMGLIVARTLGPQQYGQYTLAFALANVLAGMAIFGLDSVVAREAAQHRTKLGAVALSALYPTALLALIASIAVYVAGWFLRYPVDLRLLLLIVGPIIGLKNIVVVARAFFRGALRMDLDVAVQAIEALGSLVLVIAAMVVFRSAIGASLAIAVAQVLALAVTVVWVWRLVGTSHRWDPARTLDLLRSAAPLGFAFAVMGLGFRFDMLLLSVLRPSSEVGLYGAAFACVLLSRAVSYLSPSLLPHLASLLGRDPQRFTQLLEKGLRFTLISGIPIGAATSMLAPLLLHLLYGPDFAGGVPALRILGLMACLLFVTTYLNNVLIACKSERAIAVTSMTGVAATAIVGTLLIPYWGMRGAAVAALAREFVHLLMMGYVVSKHATTTVRRLWALVWPSLAASVAVVITLFPVRDQQGLNALLYVPLAGGACFLALWLTNAIGYDDVRIVRGAILTIAARRSNSQPLAKS